MRLRPFTVIAVSLVVCATEAGPFTPAHATAVEQSVPAAVEQSVPTDAGPRTAADVETRRGLDAERSAASRDEAGTSTDAPSDEAGAATDAPHITVDADGVMRWNATGDEVALFGVNYSTPFAFAYRAHQRLGVSHKDAIDADVTHMARLGLDAYRVHVWDREVSDAEGNLLANEHLDLLDYLIARLAERDISILLTPIAWWGNGWPEPDTPTPGFSNHYSRAELSSDPAALRIQHNYITQFLEHENPYTGHTYRDDPAIIAFELFNEPRHPEPPAETTHYINALVDAARATGLDKPIFYNVSQNWSTDHARAVSASNVDGVSFQWYPAGLVRGRGIDGNVLPHVDRYPIPAEGIDGFQSKARMVYEFDAADVAGSYVYPAMARSFREAGMQWATQFSYDPLAIAGVNTEYSTHFVNLVYAPSKGISLMIAAEAFRVLPRNGSYGRYPENTSFGPVRVSYEQDLSELNAPSRFYHSRATSTAPASLDSLRQIAGVGSSPVVAYEGTGAYFIDRLADGVWRLEVYPDAMQLRDPYGDTTTHHPVAKLVRRRHVMTIDLPDLGASFVVDPMNEGNVLSGRAERGTFSVDPGVYVLHRPDLETGAWTPSTPLGGGRLGEFFVPQLDADSEAATGSPPSRSVSDTAAGSSPPETVADIAAGSRPSQIASDTETASSPSESASEAVVSTPPSEAVEGGVLRLQATVISQDPPDAVYAYVRHFGSGWFEHVEMNPADAYEYRADVRSRQIRAGLLEYYVVVERDSAHRSYPGGIYGNPYDWDFPDGEGWFVPVVEASAPLVVFETRRDNRRMYYPHQDHYVRYETDLVAGSAPYDLALQAVVESLEPAPHHFALQASTIDHIRAAGDRLSGFDAVAARVRAIEPSTRELTLALITSDGASWSATVPVDTEWRDVAVPISALTIGPRVLLPRPYPFFLPYWYDGPSSPPVSLSLDRVESVEFSIDGRSGPNRRDAAHGYEIERVMLINQNL